jgi:formylglycine-generating enzyme required for sulfatase activity
VPAESDGGIEALWRDNLLSDIFISYAEEDREQARRLAEALEAQGWSVFWDRTILPGKTWRQVIDTALHEARCVIVAWSEASILSSWVCEEADEGRERKVLVPVLLSAVKPPRGFRAIQAASLVNWDGRPTAEEFQQLVSAVADILGPPKQPAAPRLPPERSEPVPAHKPESPAPRESPREKGRKGQGPTLWIAGLALGVVIAGLVAVQMRGPESPQLEKAETAGKGPVVGEVPSPSAKSAKDVEALKPGSVFRDTLRDGSSGPEMVSIPPGESRTGDIQGSGDADEQPVHSVRIPRPFAMGRYEVTFDEYNVFARATGRKQPADEGWGRRRRPVINVSWEDARAYAQWLSERTGKRYRLPTEAEWEYAARAGTSYLRFWGDDPSQACKYANVFDKRNQKELSARYEISWEPHDCEDPYPQIAPVGSFDPNPWGLYDMLGNVWEWVQDCYHNNYEGAPADGSAWEKEGCALRVIRGGSWYTRPWNVRSASRYRFVPDYRSNSLGFRLAQDLD